MFFDAFSSSYFIQELLVFTVFLYWTFTVNSSVVDVFVVTIEPL